jgi:4-hydroxy-2-oxoheptanedioate aldolase
VPGVDPLDLTSDVVGGWLQLPGSATAEIMGTAGFGFVCLDQQHGLIGDDALLPMLQALAATRTPAIVRVPANEPAAIGRALDRGAAGVLVPLVGSAGEAASAVAACHHPPRGTRSYGPTRLAWAPLPADPLCIVMIETVDAVEQASAIAAVEGLDAVFVGPSDLALSAGLPITAQLDDPDFAALLKRVAEACHERGLPLGIYCASPAHVHRFRELGCTFFALMSETALLRGAAAQKLAESRAHV